MIEWESFLVIVHIFGATLGVGAATFAEIFLLKSLKDGVIDPVEGSFLQVTYRIIRIGLALLIFSGFGLFLLYRLEGATDLLYNPVLWAKMSIVIIIIINAVLMQSRKIPIRWGSPLSLASWHATLILGAWHGLVASYLEIAVWYGVWVALVFVGLYSLRKLLHINL